MLDKVLNRVAAQSFNASIVRQIADKGRSTTIERVAQSLEIPRSLSLRQIYDVIYEFLFEQYRCEYVYKNAIINKILLGKHSLNTTAALSEFRIGSYKTDLVLLNSTSSAYEIKSEYDKLDKLPDQINSYKMYFDKIYVVTHIGFADKVDDVIPGDVGIMILSDKYTIKTLRQAKSNKKNVVPKQIIHSLRKQEYCQLVESLCGFVPSVPNTQLFMACKEILAELPPERVHNEMIKILKKRQASEAMSSFVTALPASLKQVGISGSLSKRQMKSFEMQINT